ncbi:MAG: hypothetical protein MR817_14865, partial [Lachnospiraceae bacterium]|nr:hypothetical protein [Lachnospiraceae bacterium]
CLFVKVQARQVFVQSFLKACFHKMFCAKDCCATALNEQCFSASCPCLICWQSGDHQTEKEGFEPSRRY